MCELCTWEEDGRGGEANIKSMPRCVYETVSATSRGVALLGEILVCLVVLLFLFLLFCLEARRVKEKSDSLSSFEMEVDKKIKQKVTCVLFCYYTIDWIGHHSLRAQRIGNQSSNASERDRQTQSASPPPSASVTETRESSAVKR